MKMNRGRDAENNSLETFIERMSEDETAPNRSEASQLPEIQELPAPGSQALPGLRQEVLRNVKLKVRVELGRKKMPLGSALNLASGTVVEFGKSADDTVEIVVNDVPIARGQVLVVDDRFCVRITEVLSQQNSMGGARK